MKYILFAAVICLSGSSASAAQICSEVPEQIGGLVQVNTDASVSILNPKLAIASRKFSLTASFDTATGVCKLMNKNLVNYKSIEGKPTKTGQTVISLSPDGSVESMLMSTEEKRYYQIDLIICK